MEKLQTLSHQFEEKLQDLAKPLRPWLPFIARFLLVITYIEDAFRIIFQYLSQERYLMIRLGYHQTTAMIFLMINVLLQLVGSTLVLARVNKALYIGTGLLVLDSLLQLVGYHLYFDFSYLLRTLSVFGGLLLLLSHSLSLEKGRSLFPGLPDMSQDDRATYLQLIGRILLVFLLLALMLGGEMSIGRSVISILGVGLCVMVMIGFKARATAALLVAVLSILNIVFNNYWSLAEHHPLRDFRKYDFFHTLSVMGGLLLLADLGPGGISLDEKKKRF